MNNPLQILFQLLQSGNNPQSLIENLARQNPNVNAVLSQVKQSGMSYEQFAKQLASQRNIDLNSLVANIKGMMNRKP